MRASHTNSRFIQPMESPHKKVMPLDISELLFGRTTCSDFLTGIVENELRSTVSNRLAWMLNIARDWNDRKAPVGPARGDADEGLGQRRDTLRLAQRGAHSALVIG